MCGREPGFPTRQQLNAFENMSAMEHPSRLIVPYGTECVPKDLTQARVVEETLSFGETGEVGRPGAPVVSLDLVSGETLPMSGLRHPFALPPMAQDLAHGASQLECLRGHLIKLCGLWAKPQVAFIEAYFDAIQSHVDHRKVELTARIGALAGLVEPAHWCFSAPMPLPRAHIFLDKTGHLSDQEPAQYIRVDTLFCVSQGLLAVDLSRGNLMASRRRELAALEAAGVRVLRTPDLPDESDLLTFLGPDFSGFTDGVDLPDSPFHGTGLPAPT